MFSIDLFWIFKALCFALWGIMLSKVAPSAIRNLLKDDNVFSDGNRSKMNKLFFSLILVVGAIGNCAIISFMFFSPRGMNLTIVSSLIVVPILLWEILLAGDRRN
jgi:hypothetical protein